MMAARIYSVGWEVGAGAPPSLRVEPPGPGEPVSVEAGENEWRALLQLVEMLEGADGWVTVRLVRSPAAVRKIRAELEARG